MQLNLSEVKAAIELNGQLIINLEFIIHINI